MLKTYNAADVSIIFGTRALTGLAEGTFVTIARDEDSFTKQVGADGEVTRSKTSNRSGTAVLVLQQASDANDFLSESLIADEAAGTGVKPFKMQDKSGNSLAFGRESWVRKPADNAKGRDSGENTWTLDIAELDDFVGGN